MSMMLERACRRVAIRDGRDPDSWRDYIDSAQRDRVFAEIDAERDRGLLLCVVLLLLVIFGPVFVGVLLR